MSYGTSDDEFNVIGGLMIRFGESSATTSLWDGHNLHHILEHWFESGDTVGVVLAEIDGRYSFGVSWSDNFGVGGGEPEGE